MELSKSSRPAGRNKKKRLHPAIDKIADPQKVFVDILRIALRNLPPESEARVAAEGYLRSRRLDLLYSWAEGIKETVYPDPYSHYVAHQLVALIMKHPLDHTAFGLDKSPRETAVKTFYSSEEKCRRTNRRILAISRGRSTRFTPLLEEMKRFCYAFFGVSEGEIHWCSGSSTGILDGFSERCDFGGGSSIGIHGNATSFARKIDAEKWTVGAASAGLAFEALWSNDQIRHYLLSGGDVGKIVCYNKTDFLERIKTRLQVTDWNKIDFVPKTAKTHRSIAIEPLLNTYVQKGIDQVMRDRLRKFGYDLSDQGANQELARVGSVDGSFATLDLSSASDTLSRELVRYLVPPGVYAILSAARSPSYKLDGKVARYEKFTSMGNGFCFPLETLVFAAAARASMRATLGHLGRHCVYGDDIIVPTSAYALTVALLQFLGFTPNPSKSFSKGPFRESCGTDWYKGQDVRPVYWDTLCHSVSDMMIFHNATLATGFSEDFFAEVRLYLRSQVPKQWRFCGLINRVPRLWRKLETWEVRDANGYFQVPIDVLMSSHYAWWDREQLRWRWKSLRFAAKEDPLYRSLPDSQTLSVDYMRYISLLRGSPGGRISLRFTTEVRTTVR